MSKCLLNLAANFRVDNILVPWEKLISTDTLPNELAHALSRCRWPSRTFEEIREELLRLQGRWMKQQSKSETYLKFAAKHTFLWIDDSEDEDDIFMPPLPSSASSKGKSSSSSKGKSSSSSKGKSSASMEDDDDDFM
jgi:hypothetical protein